MKNNSDQSYWEKYWTASDHQPEVIHEELIRNLEKISEIKSKNILEVGAGMGGDSILLSQKGATLTVVDFTKEALEAISKNAKEKNVIITPVLADAKSMPFNDGEFDIVFSQGFLEHFRNPEDYLKEQKRVVKKGGLIVIDVPQKYTTYTIKKHLAIRRGDWFAGWETEFSIGRLEKLLKNCGFEIAKSYGWGYYGKLYKIKNLKLGKWYQKFWNNIEASRLNLYLTFSIGVIAKKI